MAWVSITSTPWCTRRRSEPRRSMKCSRPSRLERSRHRGCIMWEMALMKPYLISLGAGILVGIVYSLLTVRSPAPPVIALVGLLGMLVGEQVVPLAKRLISSEPVSASWLKQECAPHILGTLPVGESKEAKAGTPDKE